MARDKQIADLMSAVEALLFVSDEPVSAARLADILEVGPVQVDEALVALAAEYRDENRGIQLREVAGGWRFYTHPAHNDVIERYVISWDTHRMSQAALEALAVIAYHQPVTRAMVNAIRGVNSESVVSSLVEKGLVREMGRDKPGGLHPLWHDAHLSRALRPQKREGPAAARGLRSRRGEQGADPRTSERRGKDR